MSAPELTDKAVAAIDYRQIRPDRPELRQPRHGRPYRRACAAAIKAVETVDAGLGAIAEAMQPQGGALLVTADHGNCELMRDPETGGPHTAHTLNPVPVLCAGGTGRREAA